MDSAAQAICCFSGISILVMRATMFTAVIGTAAIMNATQHLESRYLPVFMGVSPSCLPHPATFSTTVRPLIDTVQLIAP